MSWRVQGIGASPGRVMGRVRRLRRDLPRVEHRTISNDRVDRELERFERARQRAVEHTRALRERTEERLGEVEAKIFEPQLLMLDDPELVEGTRSYIGENYLSAERAFDWKLLELRSQFLDSAHGMVADRLADLRDIRLRVLSELLGETTSSLVEVETGDVLALRELTPSLAVELDPGTIGAVLTAAGSRASHGAVLARSLGIPAVVGIGDKLDDVEEGATVLLNGSTGRVVVDPTEDERSSFRSSQVHSEERRRRIEELARLPAVTRDGVELHLQVNLDQPDEVDEAVRVGAEGVGLFRSEFLVIGRRTIPTEDEQLRAYRKVVEAFPEHDVTLRTFDIGGDKFPIFLEMTPEENPYLGWRAIRICLDLPDLFRNQLRAALRAGRHGRLRLLLPFVTSVDEVRRARELLREVQESLDGERDPGELRLGVMIETPAALDTVDLLAPHVDFLSLGTNDLTQYTLAVDRGNARLADRYEPLHPALLRAYAELSRAARRHDLPLGVCGDLATDPVGFAALLGLGYRSFSLPPSSLLEVKEWARAVSVQELEAVCEGLGGAESAGEIRAPLARYLEGTVPAESVASGRLSGPY